MYHPNIPSWKRRLIDRKKRLGLPLDDEEKTISEGLVPKTPVTQQIPTISVLQPIPVPVVPLIIFEARTEGSQPEGPKVPEPSKSPPLRVFPRPLFLPESSQLPAPPEPTPIIDQSLAAYLCGEVVIEDCDDFYRLGCPYCGIPIVVMKNELACKIFRCGQYKANGTQINPHESKAVCDQLRESGQINGCARPFTFDGKNLNVCDYI